MKRTKGRSGSAGRVRETRTSRLEALESRQLMAADLGGVVRNGSQWLLDTDRDPDAEISQVYGLVGDPFYVAGKWADAVDRPGVVRKGSDGLLHWLLDTNGDANPDRNIAFGFNTDRPVVGDWDGDGRDNVGVVRPGADGLLHWFMDLDGDPTAEREVAFGFPTDVPVPGDWDGNGRDDPGIARRGGDGLWHWFLDLDSDPAAEIERAFGLVGSDRPIPGDWNGDGRDTLGVTRPGADGLLHWFLDANGDIWADEERAYGFTTDVPVKGAWRLPTPDTGNTLATARIVSSLKAPATYIGAIETPSDVDLFRIQVTAGQRIWIDIDTPTNGAPGLGSYLRVFNANGQQLAANNDAQAPNEPATPAGEPHFTRFFDSYIGYTFATSGTYYVGVSNWQNRTYNPATGASTLLGNPNFLTGEYSLTLTRAASSPGAFDIQISTGGMTAAQREVFKAAETRWESVITSDVPDVIWNGIAVDDLRIDATVTALDGIGGILAEAAPDYARSGSLIPIHGFMRFDSADITGMERDGTLYDVVLHEMGHVLGIGTLWGLKGLLAGAGGSNPRYVGRRATAEYNTIFRTSGSSIPVENTGGPGTRDGHWRESVFDNEIMTGFVESPNIRMPLSRITVGALADLGYTVDMGAADIYLPPTRSVTIGNVAVNDRVSSVRMAGPIAMNAMTVTTAASSAGSSPINVSHRLILSSLATVSADRRLSSQSTTPVNVQRRAWSEQVDSIMEQV